MKNQKNYDSLRKILKDRQENYSNRLLETANRVYATGNLHYIASFENVVEILSSAKNAKTLEGIISAIVPRQKKKIAAEYTSKRKRLTFYQYSKSRDRGMTNEQIKKTFRMDTPYQICGFARHYVKDSKKN